MESSARFKTIVAGRRSGKTEFVTNYEIAPYLTLANKNIWIVAPTYDLTTRIWDILYGKAIRDYKPFIRSLNSSKGNYRIETVRGTVIEAKSGDNPQNLVGKGLDRLIIDEAGILKEKCWQESLRPALADRRGSAVFIGTPKGKNWFYNLYVKGQDQLEKDFASWRFATSDNDAVPGLVEEMANAKRELPQMEYNQEWLAEFIDDAGQVFRKIQECAWGQLEEPIPGEEYVIGCDWAKSIDFTVMFVAKKRNRSIVAFERFNQIDFELQKNRLTALSKRYNNAYCLIDQSGIGEPLLDSLKGSGLSIEGYKTGVPGDKEVLIRKLAIAIEQGELTYPPIPELINELETYDYKITPSGNFSYGAPEGLHDDCVIALGLTYMACTRGGIVWAGL